MQSKNKKESKPTTLKNKQVRDLELLFWILIQFLNSHLSALAIALSVSLFCCFINFESNNNSLISYLLIFALIVDVLFFLYFIL